jgi:hypothetical protein
LDAREEDGGEDADDRDHRQEFDERETATGRDGNFHGVKLTE